ncbi:hypothetical protein ACF3NG_01735 [Aerococcaceae bacterium WGS1372]
MNTTKKLDNLLLTNIKIKNLIIYALIFFSIFMFLLLPTSSNGIIYEEWWVVIVWGMSLITLGMLFMLSKQKNYNIVLLILIAIFLYLSFVTFIIINTDVNARVSIARIAPIMVLVLFTNLRINFGFVSFDILRRLLDIVFCIVIFWNILIVIDNSSVIEFTMANYSQYYTNALLYSVAANKPVMTFGVHTYAAMFYMFFYYLSLQTAKVTEKNRYYFFCVVFVFFTILLRSNTSLIYSIIMIGFFFTTSKDNKLFPIILVVLGFISLIANIDSILDIYKNITSSNLNGFVARYTGEDTVFKNNLSFLSNYLGTGFTIIDGLNYSDSGYMVYLTMGNIPLVLSVYFLLYRYIINNIPKEQSKFVLFILFSFELALPATLNYRFIYLMVFVTIYFQTLESHRQKKLKEF